jgi:hypothetical protein
MLLMDTRRLVQWLSAIISNAYFKGFASLSIYQGVGKRVCVPVLNCYSCPGALGSCPVGSMQSLLALSFWPGSGAPGPDFPAQTAFASLGKEIKIPGITINHSASGSVGQSSRAGESLFLQVSLSGWNIGGWASSGFGAAGIAGSPGESFRLESGGFIFDFVSVYYIFSPLLPQPLPAGGLLCFV